MYEKVNTNLNFVEREKKIEQFWKDNDIFKKSMEQKEGCPQYMFYDGPPTANGKPHIGHVLTRVIKDLVPRYWTMKGYEVPRKAGWDTHGLPVEIEVEKLLGLDGKEQIEEYGLDPFIRKCKESVWQYKGMWEDFSSTVGFWADMENPYVTYENDYIESVWWSLKQIWDKDLLYKGYKIVPYCPRCGTPLSSHEVAQGYKDVKERTAIAKFKAAGENAYFLAWTTTPWTLPSNTALCVNPKETYVKVQQGEDFYYLAEALCDKVLGEDYTIIKRYTGKDLEYKEYHQLIDEVDYSGIEGKMHFVVCDDYVTMEDGTGIVHIAPAFGEDDSRIGRGYNLPFVQFVDGKGELTKETPWEGIFVKKADELILQNLKEAGRLFAAPMNEHSYPFCWRCDTPLIYYARESWYIKMSAVKEDLIRNNNTVNWVPENIGKGRFGDWLENVQDWAVSRNRYWGTPLNIWECECGCKHAIGSIEELKSMSENCPDDIELHRPYIDDVTIKCPKCGKEMRRVPEVIDCWYDSGSMPFAQYHYPFENEELFKAHFPADFISEAVDQTRGWFYSLMAISTLIFNQAPYKNVIVLGHVQDKDGQKMSKSKGNAVDPFDALRELGADAIRWYFYTNSAPWLPSRFHDDAVVEGQRKFMGTLWNTYAFYVLYANIDNFNAKDYKLEPEKLSVMDKWILSKLNTLIKDVDENMQAYKIPESGRVLQDFIDDLSNWYVRRCRERFWAKGMEQDKINAYMTLYTCITTFCLVAAPFIPFMTEDIYQNLVRKDFPESPESIHLAAFPTADESFIDKELEENMEHVLDVVVMGRACRNNANVKNRQPLANMYIKAPWKMESFYTDIVADELNVKSVEMKDDVRDFSSYSFKPQLKTVGPKFGKQVGEIRNALAALDGNKAMDEINETGSLKLALANEEVVLDKEDLLIETAQVEGFESMSDYGITVVLNLNLTDELVEEGFIREIVSKIQTMRKEAGFEVMDMITIYISDNEKVEDIVRRKKEMMLTDVMATDVVIGSQDGITKSWDINGQTVNIGVKKN